MADIGYHRGLDILDEAARRTRCGMRCLRVSLAPPGGAVWEGLRGAARRAHRRHVFRQHLELPARLRETPPEAPVLVREFSTLPLVALSARLRPRRGRLFLAVNHNLQWALRSPVQRLGFRFLDRAGFRFAFFEILPAGVLAPWGFHLSRHRVLPLPVAAEPAAEPGPPADPPRVALAGQYRREKGMDGAILELLDERSFPFRLRVGVPNPEEFRRSPAFARRAEYEWVETRGAAAFRAFLSESDVVALNYEARAYRYRPSGLVADAAAAGVPVVAPDFPVQRVQVRTPVPVGEIRAAGEPLGRAIGRALDARRAGGYDFRAYAAARGPDALARILDAWMDGP